MPPWKKWSPPSAPRVSRQPIALGAGRWGVLGTGFPWGAEMKIHFVLTAWFPSEAQALARFPRNPSHQG